ncbi:MAG: BatD family protein [Chromatiales bacterium]|nr:BatD family protein [Chromatiales bacterium]
MVRWLLTGWLLLGTGLAVAADFSHRLSDETPWTREAIYLMVEVADADRFAVLETEAPQLPGMEAVLLPYTREGGRLRIGWALFAQAPGAYRVELPPVRYRLGGVTEHSHQVPPQVVSVRALPSYIPPTLSVGEVRIASTVEPAGLLRPGRLAYWRIRLAGDAVLPEALPHVLQQIESTADVEFLAPRSRRQMTPGAGGVHGEVVHEVPFKPRGSGLVRLPALEYQYFDPATGRLARVRHAPPTVLALAPGWRLLAGLFLLALVAAGGYTAGRRLHRAWRRHRGCAAALRRLAVAGDATAVLRALQDHARAAGRPAGPGLEAWLAGWEAVHGEDGRLAGWLGQLAAIRYGRADAAPLPALRDALLRHLRQPPCRPARFRCRGEGWLPAYFPSTRFPPT